MKYLIFQQDRLVALKKFLLCMVNVRKQFFFFILVKDTKTETIIQVK